MLQMEEEDDIRLLRVFCVKIFCLPVSRERAIRVVEVDRSALVQGARDLHLA